MLVSKKVQVEFQDGTIAQLDRIASRLREKRNNYKLGVATVISEFVESVISHQPEVIEQIVMTDDPNTNAPPGTGEVEHDNNENRPVYKRVRVKRMAKGGTEKRTQTQTDKENDKSPRP